MLAAKYFNFSENIDWDSLIEKSRTTTFFQTKEWFKLWLKHFGGEALILGIYDGEELIGIAPFLKQEETIYLLGTSPVPDGHTITDYGDIIAKEGREREVWGKIIEEIGNWKLEVGKNNKLELNFIREDSPSFGILKELGGREEPVEVAPYVDLPKTWEEYLGILGRHKRHELRRKIRKFEDETGAIAEVIFDQKESDIDEFIRLMKLSSDDKKNFLTKPMEDFFKDVYMNLRGEKKARLCFLKLKDKNIASLLFFEFKEEILLYNSGYDQEYNYLSVGLLSVALLIKNAIETGKKRFDFLRGGEKYKYDLGGKERKLYKFTSLL